MQIRRRLTDYAKGVGFPMAALTVLLTMQSGVAAQEEDQEETPQWVTWVMTTARILSRQRWWPSLDDHAVGAPRPLTGSLM